MQVKQVDYQHQKEAPYFFKDLTFELPIGKLHALHGKNGIGKTVLLNLLSGKIPSQAVVKGEVIGSKNAVLVQQRFDQMIADQFSFLENLQFACMKTFPTLFSRLQRPKFLPLFLDQLHVDYSKPAHLLSGGQRQILALLMVLQKETKFLLLDEPTATLDEENAQLVFDFLIKLTQQGVTILVVCHDKHLVSRYTSGQTLRLELDHKGLRTLVQEIA